MVEATHKQLLWQQSSLVLVAAADACVVFQLHTGCVFVSSRSCAYSKLFLFGTLRSKESPIQMIRTKLLLCRF